MTPLLPTPDATPKAHIAALDGVRGLAILLVLLHHLRPDISGPSPFNAGWIGVDLFFVLSGYLITGILLQSKGQPGYYRAFYVRRVLRILPLYYGVVLLLVLLDPEVRSLQVWYWTHTFNWLYGLTGTWVGLPIGTIHFWSLAIEEQFYLFWPLAVAFTTRRGLLRLCGAIWCVSLLGRLIGATLGLSWDTLYVLTPFRLDGLALGAALAVVGPLHRVTFPARWLAVATGTLVLVAAFALPPSWAMPPMRLAIELSVLSILWGSVLVLAVTTPIGNRLFSRADLRVFGRYSYGLYLLHPLVKIAADPWFSPMPPVLYSVALISLSLLVAMLVYHLWEAPWLRLKRYAPMPSPP